jgi:hypothetical protein
MALRPPFKPGEGGRPKGAKNRLSWAFLSALAQDFEEHGAEAIRIMQIEKPNEYVRAVASLMPRELDITTNTLMEVPDDELDSFITYARERLIIKRELVGDPGSREEPAVEREPVALLPGLQKAG